MNTKHLIFSLFPLLFWASQIHSAVLFVDINSPDPVVPYTNWQTSALTIQEAIDAASDGDTIVVTNGVYRTGGRTTSGSLTNRVVVDKAVTVESANGPEATFIEGNPIKGEGAIRCVYLADGAALIGFTITNGGTMTGFLATNDSSGGGIWCESTNALISNCIIVSNTCSYWGAGVFSGTVRNSQISSNHNFNFSPAGGGGAAFSVIYDSTLIGNRSGYQNGGGAKNSILSNCVVRSNSDGIIDSTAYYCSIVENEGRGMAGGSAFYSLIASNSDYMGGGAMQATLNNCLVTGNRAFQGGGVMNSVLNSCTISNNYATNSGGGMYWSGIGYGSTSMNPGTNNLLIGNTSGKDGGGMWIFGNSVALTNWVFRANVAVGNGGGCNVSGQPNFDNCEFSSNSSVNGAGLFVQSGSVMCVDSTFSNNIATSDGGGVYRALLRNCVLISNQAVNGAGAYAGEMGGCIVENNRASLNGGGGFGISGFITNCILKGNSAENGGGLHVYNSMGISNCVFQSNSARTNGGGLLGQSSLPVRNSLFSSNQATFGGAAHGGLFVNSILTANRATNSGGAYYYSGSPSPMTSSNNLVSGNWVGVNGGGIHGGNWSNSQFANNSAGQNGGAGYFCGIQKSILTNNSALLGGGVYFGSLTHCLVTGNKAEVGGAAYNSNNYPINRCTIVGNVATNNAGGVFGTAGMSMVNSIVYFNSAPLNNNYTGTSNSFCCLTPLSPGMGNIADDPTLIDSAAGNFRLQMNSPCINTGGGPLEPKDLDGRQRIVGGRIDMGAYEFQGVGLGEFTEWLSDYGLPTDGSVDLVDMDADGHNNWQEWDAGTIPTNQLSVLRLTEANLGADGVAISWQSVSGKTYVLERGSGLNDLPAFSVIQSNIVGQAGTTTVTDQSATNAALSFYRVQVQ